jgi:hypothetical protein
MKKSWPTLLLVACGAAFALGMFELFKLRYEVGDVYPEYSSLRSDPLGTMILFESLERTPHLSVRRDFSTENQLPEIKSVTYLHLAASRQDWTSLPMELFQEIDGYLARGGRLVITLLPEFVQPTRFAARVPPPGPVPPSKKGQKLQKETERLMRQTMVKEHWGLEFAFLPTARRSGGVYQSSFVTNQTDLSLPAQLEWHSGVILTNLGPGWRTIYARGTNAVVVERSFGSGTVVIATDSYLFSNEAMSKDRHADLLAWFVGSSQHIFFDEAHLGITETPGVASLMRKYRLHGLAAGFLILAGLFIWRNATSLGGAYTDAPVTGAIAGRAAGAGFVNLLRRNLPPRDLLRTCFEEWAQSLGHDSGYSIARVDQAQTVIEEETARAQSDRDPVRAYREICRVLKGGKEPL